MQFIYCLLLLLASILRIHDSCLKKIHTYAYGRDGMQNDSLDYRLRKFAIQKWYVAT